MVEATLTSMSVMVHALADGFVVFDFSQNPEFQGGPVSEESLRKSLYQSAQGLERGRIVGERVRLMNAFLACLYEGAQPFFGAEAQPNVNPENYMSGTQSNDGEWWLHGPCLREGHQVASADAIPATATLFDKVVTAYGNDACILLSLLQLASYHYSTHSFSASLTIAWSVVEFIQNTIWRDYLKSRESNTSINKKRRETLTSKDFTASIVSQALSLGGQIDDRLLEELDKARRKRNEFAHYLKPVKPEDASGALNCAATLISRKIGQQFRLGLSYSWRP